jgi:putative ABC transport system substrate-binding protein
MTTRRALLIALGALAALPAYSQLPGKIWRIGFMLGIRTPDGNAPSPLRQGLQALGYVEGKNVIYEARFSQGRPERFAALASELVAKKVDLIFAGSGPGSAAAKLATSTIPIIAFQAGDVVETGLVPSLARPGGNVTGVNDPAAELSAKRLEILKEVVPSARRFAVLWNAGDNAMTLRFREIERAAKILSVAIEPLPVREPDDFDVAMAAMNRARPDALIMVADGLTNLNRQRVIDYAAKNRIPAMYEQGAAVQAGGLMPYGAGAADINKMLVEYAAKILKGAKPADLPVEQPNRYYLDINLKTATALGITIPHSVLLRADEVIK